MSSDETQHSPESLSIAPLRWTRTLMHRLALPRFRRAAAKPASDTAPAEHAGLHPTLRALPTLLDSSSLPDGVVELLIEDFEAPAHQLFDIHDGHVTLVEPGKCVPWACIAGPPTAWALALGPSRDTAALQLTGDKQLARRVLAALPHKD